MRSKPFALFTALMFVFILSCRKSVDEAVDCLGESFLLSFTHSVAPTNSREIRFTVNYTGTHDLTSVTWDYGDGSTQAVNAPGVVHIYTAPGTYEVKANITLKRGNTTCVPHLKTSVIVN